MHRPRQLDPWGDCYWYWFGYGQHDHRNLTCTSGAFEVATTYNNNGKYDWFMPSKDELNALYAYRTQLGFDLYTFLYWSSSEYNYANAWMQDFGDGSQDYYWKSERHMIPVRAG